VLSWCIFQASIDVFLVELATATATAAVTMPVGLDEEQHYESFNMDNDYEGLVEIDGEFLYREKKKKRMQTRDDQLYGYQSSDEEDEGFGRKGGKRSKADYTKPVGFVSSGVFVQQPDGDGKPKEQQQQQQPGSSDGAAPAPAAAAGLGFKAAGTAAGLGFSSGSSQGKEGLGSAGTAGAGLGFSGTGNGGLGFRLGGVQTNNNSSADGADGRHVSSSNSGSRTTAARKHQPGDYSDDEAEDEAAVLPTAFGRRCACHDVVTVTCFLQQTSHADLSASKQQTA
jgi:tuftelin-interacting protein 11